MVNVPEKFFYNKGKQIKDNIIIGTTSFQVNSSFCRYKF